MSRKNEPSSNPARARTTDREAQGAASASETAEYVAQMCAELKLLAKSSADYIASMTCELSTLASSAKLDRLSALLDSVREEAESAA
jgi:hypothetical protein